MDIWSKIILCKLSISSYFKIDFFSGVYVTQKKKMAEDKKKEPVFKDLQAEDPDAMPTEIESMCMNCGENVRHFCTKGFPFP